MSFLVKRLFKINVSLKTRVFFFFPMRVGPVRVTIYNERAVAQVDIRKFREFSSFAPETKRIHEI